MLEWVEQEDYVHHLDPVQFTIRLLVPPGSALLAEPEMKPFLGPLVEETLSYPWTHPDPRMDALHQSVSRLVEEAAARREQVPETFARIRALAGEVAGRAPARAPERTSPRRPRPPRLTEDWFC